MTRHVKEQIFLFLTLPARAWMWFIGALLGMEVESGFEE